MILFSPENQNLLKHWSFSQSVVASGNTDPVHGRLKRGASLLITHEICCPASSFGQNSCIQMDACLHTNHKTLETGENEVFYSGFVFSFHTGSVCTASSFWPLNWKKG